MSQLSEDTATNRFRAWWAGLLATLSFALICLLVLAIAGDALDKPDLLASDIERAGKRDKNLEDLKAVQTAAVTEAAVVDDASNTIKLPVEKALPLALGTLNKKITKSNVPVPGAAIDPVVPTESE